MANWAISIGINSYDNLQHLKYAKRDAEVIHDWFKEKAKFDQVFLFTEDSPPILGKPSPIATQPTFGRLQRFLRAQFEKPLLKNGDNLWFFFAGHGIRAADGDYLMLSDTDPGDVKSTALSVNYVTERLRRCGADNVVLFLDACRNEGDRSGLGIGTDEHQGVITFYSCASNQKSYEIDELQHGSFTKVLLDGLQIQGEGNCATVERLEQYLKSKVPQITQSYKKVLQNPYAKVEPSCKKYLILLEEFATIRDADSLKIQAFLAENQTNFLLAEQLWIRVLAILKIDSDAIGSIKRIALLKKVNPQIVSIEEFIKYYNKRADTPIDKNFHFREKELNQVLSELEKKNLVLIYGKAGIGKSRLALECCKHFLTSHPEYQVKCILNRNGNIFDNIHASFSESNCLLIFVDDVDRVTSFDYFIDLLYDQGENQKFKVIGTVRDYAYEKVNKFTHFYKNKIEIEIPSLQDQEIQEIIRNNYQIFNYFYLDRITNIAQGNPRLAIMATLLAKQENNLESINNVSNLYDEYYFLIRVNLEELNDENLLKAAGLVSFFRTVDRSDKNIMQTIEIAFGINQGIFWQTIQKLHELEFLDIYENEVVRVSDQVLTTYFFYLAFFKKKLLDFSPLLNHFFPQFQYRFIEALNPILNNFNSEEIIELIYPPIDQLWQTYLKAEDEKNLMLFIEMFWFIERTEILIYINKRISTIKTESIDLAKVEIKYDSNIPSLSILSTLSLFSESPDEGDLKMSLQLLFKYVEKQPNEISKVFYLLTEVFGFDYESYRYGFAVQNIVIDSLLEKVDSDKCFIFSKLFIAVAKHYLRTNFETNIVKNRSSIQRSEFSLQLTPKLAEIRSKIWKNVFEIYQMDILKEDVLNFLNEYSTSYEVSVAQIILDDSSYMLPFIQSNLSNDNYYHCFIVQNYLNQLKRHNVPFTESLFAQFTNPTYALSKVLIGNYEEMSSLNLRSMEYEELRKKRIHEFFKNYNLEDYQRFFAQCLEIQQKTDRRKHNNFYFPHQVSKVLIALFERDSQLFTDVLKYYLNLGNPLKIDDCELIYHLTQTLEINDAFNVINIADYALKRKWLFNFYYLLPRELIKDEHLAQIYSLYADSENTEVSLNLNWLLKYRILNQSVLVEVVKIILNKKDHHFNTLCSLFNFNIDDKDNKAVLACFDGQLNVLKKAYFQVLKNNWHIDDQGQYFIYFLTRDSKFITEYLDWINQQKKESKCFHDPRNYSFLWQYENYQQILSHIVQYIYQYNQEYDNLSAYQLKNFFILTESTDNETLWKKQDTLLITLLNEQLNEINFVQFIFHLITNFSYKRRSLFVKYFIQNNENFEHFKKLLLESDYSSAIGSWVPVYQKKVEYFESLIPLFNGVDFLPHKQYIEQRIKTLKQQIKEEKKNDFINTYL